MRSDEPKSLQQISGRPMLAYVIAAAQNAHADRIHVVIGSDGEKVRKEFAHLAVNWVLQPEPNGTGHAVAQAIPYAAEHSIICVLYGDNPFVRSDTVWNLIDVAENSGLCILTSIVSDPAGYGRIVRNELGELQQVVEEKDASDEQLQIAEVNVGPIAAKRNLLAGWLDRLDNDNIQKEYYLPGVLDFAIKDGFEVPTISSTSRTEIIGVNTRAEQADLERLAQLKNAEDLMKAGVRILDPARFDLRGECAAGKDCSIDVNVVLEGVNTLADRVRIEANNVIRNSNLGKDVIIKPNCVIEDAEIEAGCEIGPFARIRPGTRIGKNCRVGNFVEIKNSNLGEATKVSHLAYVGDSDIGKHVNVGAGAITCNYDGKQKHRTKIGDYVFIGSNAALIAPIEIGDHSVVAAGSTISKNIRSNRLAVERSATKILKARQRGRKN